MQKAALDTPSNGCVGQGQWEWLHQAACMPRTTPSGPTISRSLITFTEHPLGIRHCALGHSREKTRPCFHKMYHLLSKSLINKSLPTCYESQEGKYRQHRAHIAEKHLAASYLPSGSPIGLLGRKVILFCPI